MQKMSLGFNDSDHIDTTSPQGRELWLRETRQLDISTSAVRILATKLTQLASGDAAKAVAIHNYVKSLPFGCVPDMVGTSASDVLRLGYGDCHAKGVLFVALLRSAGIAARLHFVTLPTRFLRGLIDTGSQTMTHAVGEVWLDDGWLQTDTYVVDTAFGRAARKLLHGEGAQLGYGVHLQGDDQWGGIDHAHAQCAMLDPESLPVVDWGSTHDAATFYGNENHAALRHSFGVRMKWMLGAMVVNKKVAQIRASA